MTAPSVVDFYDRLAPFFIEDGGDACTAHVMRSQYYAVPVARLVELMGEAGFRQVRRIDQRFFQPLIAGFKPSPAFAAQEGQVPS